MTLGQLHENSIIYHDLKQENVLIDKKGYILLSDFGLGKIPKKVNLKNKE